MMLLRPLIAASVMNLASATQATTKTWTGSFDHHNWDQDGNWYPSGHPGSNDDVVHTNSDVIQMNISSSETSPVIIKSFTCDGSEDGGLVI